MNLADLSREISEITGEEIVNFILLLAKLLTGESVPGWVSLALFAVLVILSGSYAFHAFRFARATHSVKNVFLKKDGKITKNRLIDIDRKLINEKPQSKFAKVLSNAWREFRETTVQPSADSEFLHNTLRPAFFFNQEDLGVGTGMWRQVPGLFVSVGLLLTFFGLVAALDQTGKIIEPGTTDSSTTVRGLKTLLEVASAKFIMSLTGLFCSIGFTVVLKFFSKHKDKALQELCEVIESRCDFMSEQDLLRKMLEQTKEQTTHLQKFSTELVAQFAQPLRDDLPKAIEESIRVAMQPLIEKIDKRASQGIESLLENVHDTLSESVEKSVSKLGNSINEASAEFDGVAKQLNESSETITENFHETINSFIRSAEQLKTSIELSTREIEKYAKSIEGSANNVNSSTEQLIRSSKSLSMASEPIKESIVEMQTSTALIQKTSALTEAILRDMNQVIEKSQASAQEALQALESSVKEFQNIITNYHEIDESIGDAFEKIRTSVSDNIQDIGEFNRKVNEEFGKALNRLEAVVAQAHPFTPQTEK